MQDVIIIGSGLGGLVTGAYLSKEGSSNVTVLERHYVHGGFATSFRRRPWEFDVSLHCLSGLAQGGRVGQIFEELGMFGRVEFHRAENLYRAVFPEHDLSVSGDPGAYRETLHRLFPQERGAIDGFFHACAEIREEMIHTHSRKPSTIIAYKDDSLQQMMDRFTMSKELQCMLAQFWVYFGLQPSELSAVYFAYAWTDYHHFGGYYPQGRSQRISDALKAIIEENGGRVITREDVEEITAPGGRVNGVRTKRGHEYSADLVISNIHPGQTLSRLSDPGSVPAAYREKVRRLRPSYSCLQAYLIMRGSLSEEYGEHHHEIFLNPTYDLNTIGEAIRTEQYEAMPLCITAYENIAPGYQPQPVTTLTVMQLCEAEGWTGAGRCGLSSKERRDSRPVSAAARIPVSGHQRPDGAYGAGDAANGDPVYESPAGGHLRRRPDRGAGALQGALADHADRGPLSGRRVEPPGSGVQRRDLGRTQSGEAADGRAGLRRQTRCKRKHVIW
ncbi:hypothetical protein PM3016_3899 [Paenibacillus mucilaginosus 3016]|uniref:Amine oxidase domain-containing protein n=1 Tax=Paenibacillus mucilaginosus 3016 TaxID=1116391 RepID=H6NFR2_9BACL|nr:NAD(P)/FAD-dependent oxidoreductase [Paenibacillus mucilaginosus]AFC30702.1 hypothetical protein PM3016_3899 [Paenibacillus mucilaginosus 3016]